MSASKDKIVRKQQIEAGLDKHTKAAAEAAKARRKSNIQYTVVAIVLVVVFAFIFLYNSAIPSKHLTAVSINGEDYTVAQLNYYYSSSYMSFYNNYYYYVLSGYFFDTSESLSNQAYSDDMSWRDYFLDSAVNSMTEIQLLNEQAEAAGFTLSEEDEAAYAESVESIESSWEDYGYSSLKQYLNINYGKGVTMDLVKQELYRTYVASAYSQYVYDNYEYTTQELDAYYAEHADEYDMISYAYYTVTDETMDAQAIADAVDGTSEEEFTAYMEENFEDAAPVSLTYAGSSLPSAYSDWLLDSRQVGDATAIDSDSGTTYVVMFLGRETNDYNPVDFRHILIQAEDTDGDGEYSDEEIAAAQTQAQDIYDQWLAGEATEDSFAQLAEEYSTDTGSNENGGLYEEVYKDAMVQPINDWLFADGRQAGDTEVVSYDGSNYTGTHVLFFVGADDLTYAQYQADTALRSDDYNTWLETAEADYEAVTSHLKLCGQNH
jgi:parvulin-like peptidyl-prolyl isomerase